MKSLSLMAVAAVATFIVATSPASAAPVCLQQSVDTGDDLTTTISAKRKYRRHARRGGKCDGFQRCRCGTTAARKHGLSLRYVGADGRVYNLKKASEYGRAFPHTSFRVGALGVAPHHVLTVVGGSNCRLATVYDDAGTYQRNVCNMTFVSVGG